ncbi:MAG: helix-turn-helix transcriptional regulator [Lachnospiraceae bacterium]|nr:helix-turn-helix transcriptional regulator [Lachnospiraceae bacterium]
MISTFLVEERIRQLRKQHNLSQDELAQLAGISSNYMGQIERGEKCPTLDVFLQISLALNVSPVELINDCDSMPATIYTPELNKVIQLLRTYSCSELNEVYKVLSSISKIKQPM